MKHEIQERALRIMLSSVLASNLTLGELRAISNAFLYDRELARDFGAALESTVSYIESRRHSSELRLDREFGPQDETLERMLLAVKRKRLPRRDILAMIGTISPGREEALKAREVTVEQMLREFLHTSSPSLQQDLIRLLETGRRGGDEYLHGIMQDR